MHKNGFWLYSKILHIFLFYDFIVNIQADLKYSAALRIDANMLKIMLTGDTE